MNVNQKVRIDGKALLLKGVYPETDFPQAMIFWDNSKGYYVQFATWGNPDDFIIIKE